MDTVRNSPGERDLLPYVADAARPFGEEDRRAVSMLAESPAPARLVLNKIDLMRENARLLPLIER
jgi:GTPase Era involved in 16S rRNA processing